MFPRHGSFPGFHPIVELSLTYHNLVVGSNGQRQAMYLEHVEGFGQVILRNFVFAPPDCFLIFSNSGVNEVVIDVALEAKRQNMPVSRWCRWSTARLPCPAQQRQKLTDLADVLIDNCTPGGDALVRLPGWPIRSGRAPPSARRRHQRAQVPGGRKLTARSQPPIVLTSSYFIGAEASKQRFDECYDDYRARVQKVYGDCR